MQFFSIKNWVSSNKGKFLPKDFIGHFWVCLLLLLLLFFVALSHSRALICLLTSVIYFFILLSVLKYIFCYYQYSYKMLKLIAFFIELKKKILFLFLIHIFCLLDIFHKFLGKTMRQAPVVISTAWYPKNSNKIPGHLLNNRFGNSLLIGSIFSILHLLDILWYIP